MKKQIHEQDFTVCTNEVLFKERKQASNPSKHSITYYLPCYIRLKVKAIDRVSVEDLNATVRGTLSFCLYYGNLKKEILKQFIQYDDLKEEFVDNDGQDKKAQDEDDDDDDDYQKTILLQLNNQQSIELKAGKDIEVLQNQNSREIDFIIRRDFGCTLKGNTFLTPFDLLDLLLYVRVRDLRLDPEENDGNEVIIKFNCMGNEDLRIIRHTKNGQFGQYCIASSYQKARFTNTEDYSFEQINLNCKSDLKEVVRKSRNEQTSRIYPDSVEEKKYQHQDAPFLQNNKKNPFSSFQCAYFRIPLYKYPGNSIITIFLPLWVLGLINLFIFFQSRRLFPRIANIVTISFAYIVLLPTIDNQIPKTPQIKLVQILVYLQAIATLLCLLQSYYGQSVIDPYEWSSDNFFIAAVVINVVTALIVFVLFLLHKCIWERKYLQRKDYKYQHFGVRQTWKNQQCDKYFAARIGKSLKRKKGEKKLQSTVN